MVIRVVDYFQFKGPAISHFQEFCSKHSGNAKPIPYYETSTVLSETIPLAFKEIMARPLINDYVVSEYLELKRSSHTLFYLGKFPTLSPHSGANCRPQLEAMTEL